MGISTRAGSRTGSGPDSREKAGILPTQGHERGWILGVAWCLGACFWLAMMAMNWAEGAERDASVGSGDYSFQWLDPDKKIYVLQNRRYQKAGRLQLSAGAGISSTSAYRDTYALEPRLALYFREWLGIEAFYTVFMNQENSTFEALQRSVGTSNVLPSVRELRSQMGALIKFVPWYAKINVFNQILYFDWAFSGGAGRIGTALDTRTSTSAAATYVNEDFLGLFLGTGHQYHLSDTFSVRFDYLATFYRAPLLGRTGDDTWFSSSTFSAGVGVRL